MTEKPFDLVIIGSGPGGYGAAIRGAQLGLKVACVEKEPQLGGTCLRIGCIPSKALLESSERYADAQETFARHGIRLGRVELDLPTLLQRKDEVVRTLCRGIEGLFRKHKIKRLTGTARLDGPGRVRVRGDHGEHLLEARHVLIATGSQSAPLGGVELDGGRIGTSIEALAYDRVPKRLIVIGAGYIGVELGSVWRRLGAQVVILEYLDRILSGMDAELAADAQKILGRQGLEFLLGCRVTGARVVGDHCRVECENAEPLEADRVLLAVGRVPNTKDLGLETVGIALLDNGCIPVNERFATQAPQVYAIGDVIGGPMLAHKAEEEGMACVEWLATGYGHVDYHCIPGVVYTQPEIATVGRSEEQLKEAGTEYRKGVFPLLANGRARAMGRTEGKVKVLADRKTDRVLGVHIIGAHAGELIAEATAAMTFGASSEDIARCCHAHPTLSEALKEAALGVAQRSLHIAPRELAR